MKTTINRAALALAVALSLAACGGGDDASPVSAANYSQTAPAGSITVGAAETQASAGIVVLEHRVGNKLSRLNISAEITNVRTVGNPSAAGARWAIRNGADVIAQGPIVGKAQAIGSAGTTTHEITVTGGSQITVEITGHIVGSGTALRWDSAKLSLSSTPL